MTIGDTGGASAPPSPIDIAWAAGLFEGEGCMGAYERASKTDVQVRLAMTDEDIVTRFAAIVGVGKITNRQKRPNEKRVYEWYVYSAADVRWVIEMLLPWFGQRRTEKARYVLGMVAQMGPHNRDRTHCPKGHPYEGDNLVMERVGADKHMARRCKACRNAQARNRARQRLGITPNRYRVQ